MENLENIDDFEEKKVPRPSFLTVLCILSFIAIGLSFSSGLTSLVAGPLNEDELAEIETKMVELVDELRSNEIEGMAQMIEKIGRMQVAVNEQHYAVNSTNVLFGWSDLNVAGKKIRLSFVYHLLFTDNDTTLFICSVGRYSINYHNR
jgi:hypothetical protein